ncbi:MAG: hypothetical protein D6754_01145 [Alphaproteobacteria bacterium]|nr:MAG: hypothetical protein D6754_01145 [Alphaproteobacteria bacterium]
MAFLKWQCRTRQIAMREAAGRPDDSMMPAVFLPGAAEPMGHIITVLNRLPAHSVTAELRHMAARTADPAQRRQSAVAFLAAEYYQRAERFSDLLTATFAPQSHGAARLREAGRARLVFEAYSQRFDLACRVWRLAEHHPLHAATLAHNRLFNPSLPPGTEVLGFEPDWQESRAEPEV